MAVRIEEVKRQGVAIDIDALAATGFESISEADRYRLKTQGVCAQRQVGVFMIRVRLPGGRATPAQLRRAAELATRHGHGSLHVTTRSGLELHHVRIENVPAVLAGLAEVGLTTKGACGDTLRNVVCCAHAGTYAGEVLPPLPFAQLLHDRIVAISDATNLSRKMNVAVACSPACDDHVATSDIGFVATPDPDGGAAGFAVWGAGGLGATPRLAIQVSRFLPQEDLLPAFTALVALGEKHGDRSSRARAKIKMLVERWGEERVRQVYEEELAAAREKGLPALRVAPAAGAVRLTAAPRAGGVQEERQPGLYTVPAVIRMGELSCAAAEALADTAERFGDGAVHFTTDQNAELHGVPAAKVEATVAAIERLGYGTRGRGGVADVVACVGLEYCSLAVAGSMSLGDELSRAMEPRREDPRYADFRIFISGCPHSCARHQVADLGFAGANLKTDGKLVEAFVLYVGGNASERLLGHSMDAKVPRDRVLPVVEAVLGRYEALSLAGERFSRTVARLGPEPFFAAAQAVLPVGRAPEAGAPLAAGQAGGPGAAAPGADSDPQICNCKQVSRSEILAAIRAGARDVEAIGAATRAGTGCGSCHGELSALLASSCADDSPVQAHPAPHANGISTAPQHPDGSRQFDDMLAERLRLRFEAALRTPHRERPRSLRRLARELRAAALLLEDRPFLPDKELPT